MGEEEQEAKEERRGRQTRELAMLWRALWGAHLKAPGTGGDVTALSTEAATVTETKIFGFKETAT